MREKTLFCIVTIPTDPRQVTPDVGYYSPKELAAKENTSVTSVYTWIKEGLPIMRQGKLGNIRIYYQDYIQWMIDCARSERNVNDVPAWAYKFVKSTEPRVKVDPRNPLQTSLF